MTFALSLPETKSLAVGQGILTFALSLPETKWLAGSRHVVMAEVCNYTFAPLLP